MNRKYFLIAVNYIMLFLTAWLVYRGTGQGDGLPWLLGALAAFILLLVTYYFLYHKSGIWSFIHRKADQLDERELALAREATDTAYSWFTVISLIVLFLFGYVNVMPCIHIPLEALGRATRITLMSMIYVAHILPGTFVAIKEKSQIT